MTTTSSSSSSFSIIEVLSFKMNWCVAGVDLFYFKQEIMFKNLFIISIFVLDGFHMEMKDTHSL